MSETKDYRKELYIGVYLEEVRKGKHRYDAETAARLAVEAYDMFFDSQHWKLPEEPATDEETATPEDQVRETVEELAKELEHNFLSVNYRTVGPPVACGKPGVCNHKDDRDRCCLLGTCGHQVPPRIRGAVGLDFGKEDTSKE